MVDSKLKEIINRIGKITEAEETNRTRRFARDGEDVCQVTYDPATGTFTFEDLKRNESYEFDNIDLAAIEVFDIL